MEFLHQFPHLLGQLIHLVLHLDVYLSAVISQYGAWTYAFLFLIVFCETGLVVTPFLPGDSLLFAAGAFAASGLLRLELLALSLIGAAIGGDALNYAIGAFVGPRVWTVNSRWLKREHLDRTQMFYERYGGKTIVLARFVPIIRTFAPFLAGVGKMKYWRFGSYNVAGGVLWVLGCLLGGYFFGNLPFVKKNFTLVILMIVFISVLPAMIEFLRHRYGPQAKSTPPVAG